MRGVGLFTPCHRRRCSACSPASPHMPHAPLVHIKLFIGHVMEPGQHGGQVPWITRGDVGNARLQQTPACVTQVGMSLSRAWPSQTLN